MSDEVLVKVEGVSKKFCRSLKRSLWYGVQDVTNEALGRDGHHNELRKNEFWAVNDISFELKRGECLGLIGPNGAGKSTLLKMLNGLVKPDKGRITMRGRVGALIELGAGFDPILTGRENIYVNGSVLGFTKKEIDRKFDAIVDFSEIEEFIDTPVQNYSSGMKVRLGFAVAAQMEPDVLLIDEVLAVGDTGFRAKCLNQMSQLSKQAALVFVSHSMPDVARTASRVLVTNRGICTYLGEDVAQGIDVYSKLFHSNTSYGQESARCRLIEFRVLDDQQQDLSGRSLNYMSRLFVEISFVLNIGDRSATVNLNLQDSQSRAVVQFASARSRFFVKGSHNVQTFTVEVAALPLSLGKYTFSLYFVEALEAGRKGEIFLFRHDIATLNVIDEQPSYAPVHLPAIWRTHPNPSGSGDRAYNGD